MMPLRWYLMLADDTWWLLILQYTYLLQVNDGEVIQSQAKFSDKGQFVCLQPLMLKKAAKWSPLPYHSNNNIDFAENNWIPFIHQSIHHLEQDCGGCWSLSARPVQVSSPVYCHVEMNGILIWASHCKSSELKECNDGWSIKTKEKRSCSKQTSLPFTLIPDFPPKHLNITLSP